MRIARFSFRSVFLFIVLTGMATPLLAQSTVQAWQRWEATLTAQKTYANPYKNVLLRVTWTCMSNCSGSSFWGQLPTWGFWDGGANNRTFKIRAAFPQPLTGDTAVWHWATSCTTVSGSGDQDCSSDGGFQTGSDVTVIRSDAAHGITNRLYTGGAFGLGEGATTENGQLARGNIYLTNDNGPFYWQGDTAWNASMRATFNRATTPNCAGAGWSTNAWKCYVQDRVNKSFTAIQISVPQNYMASPFTDTNSNAPFAGTNWDKWNPPYWQGFEDKVQWANEQGIVVLIVGIMQVSASTSATLPSQADAVLFARNLAARLGGNFVIYSPGFDTPPDGVSSPLIRAVGQQIDAVTTRPIITNHFGGMTPVVAAGANNDYSDFNSDAWLDTYMFQSGQAKSQRNVPFNQLQTMTQRARQMPLDLRTLPFRKGSANIESIYDNEGVPLMPGEAEPVWAPNYKPYRVRHTAYLSTLSGAHGYSLGVTGLPDWGLGGGPPYQARLPQNAVNSASSTQIQLLGNLFRAHRWEWLAPAPTIIRNNPAELNNQHLQMVASRDLTRRSTLAYLPDNAAIQLQLSVDLYPGITTARWTKQWFDPKTGARQTATPTLVSGDIYSFARPTCSGTGQNGDCDWVLELVDTTAGPRFAAGASGLQVFASNDPATKAWTITGDLMDQNGTLLADGMLISDATASVQRLPLVARTADGFVVVWEAEDLDGDRTGVFARRIGAHGEPLGKVLQVNETARGRQFEPVIASDASGAVVIAWTEAGEQADSPRIVARRFSPELEALGGELVVSSGARSAGRRSPLIAADAAGNFVVAWQEYDAATRLSAIVTRRFDAGGRAQSERILESSQVDYLALERLDLDDAGNFDVLFQRVQDGESAGHFKRSFDGRKRAFGQLQRSASAE